MDGVHCQSSGGCIAEPTTFHQSYQSDLLLTAVEGVSKHPNGNLRLQVGGLENARIAPDAKTSAKLLLCNLTSPVESYFDGRFGFAEHTMLILLATNHLHAPPRRFNALVVPKSCTSQ